MLCDDSTTVRSAYARLLEADPDLQLVGSVGNGQQAIDALMGLPREARPHVMLLDLEMPVMDGMTALPLLLKTHPNLAVIVSSAQNESGAAAAMAAMRAGAADYVPKPSAANGGMNDANFRADLVAKVKGWARMRGFVPGPAQPAPGAAAAPPLVTPPPAAPSAAQPTVPLPAPSVSAPFVSAPSMSAPSMPAASAPLPVPPARAAAPQPSQPLPAAPAPPGASLLSGPVVLRPMPAVVPKPRLLAIGSSTGGPQALAAFVRRLSTPLPVPVVVVQHMPAGFTAMLADHLGRLGGPPAAEAKDGEALRPGRLYVAPGDRHLVLEGGGGGLVARLNTDPPENFCRPAVDPMLRSAVAACEGRVLAVILTGMGQDGMLGCKAVAAAGGLVLAQDEASSVVWGMPGAVAKAGLAQFLAPPEQLADKALAHIGKAGHGPAGGMA
ncbi:chemotaxis-specific protein-glutamate methyltransferase CheB [Teichococcus aestuarii]|uniref:Protein-glutamate methylesterase/protein-glutamine glutaminase n=1 Tax=Teichococcus aestuarii TaxID=568898 RepID=A0A2U1V5N7_9PROT|nr:chemotaxis-specific protein-glutamate methyltransferase CheB [Pseudoroseomonas aestuarii]PWC29206.1 chemotaxis response regulator protein-glutamate methylesterase [Pseudoroseomonas aestuarii]